MARILVVEDEPALRHLVCEHLEADGHEVLRASSAKSAVRMAATHGPDLLLFDRRIPSSPTITTGWMFSGSSR